jgi:hypothetical protein
MPADRSFDRILFWLLFKKQKRFIFSKKIQFYFRRTIENNSFQLFEYSLSHNLLHNAIQIQFGVATNVLPNIFIVELPDRQQICLMFVTHIGIYRWILKHPTITGIGQLVSIFSYQKKNKQIFYSPFFSRNNLNQFLLI